MEYRQIRKPDKVAGGATIASWADARSDRDEGWVGWKEGRERGR